MASAAATSGREDQTPVGMVATPGQSESVDMSPAIVVEPSPYLDDAVPETLPALTSDDHPVDMPRIDSASERHDSAAVSSKAAEAEDIDGVDLQNAIAGLGYGDSSGPNSQTESGHSLDTDHISPPVDILHTSTAATVPNVDSSLGVPLDQDRAGDEGNLNHDQGNARDNADDQFSEDGDDDTFSDPGYAESAATSYCSTIRSEAQDYYYEHGRRYQGFGGGRYLIPNDDQELNREDMKHHMWRLVLDGELHLSPIGQHPQKILDVGCGSGIWPMQTADAYPSAEVIGFDISPVQPTWVPPNLQFEVDDLEQEWLWKPNSFDLIHCRFMFMSVRDWPAMLQQAYRTLKPGGYVELSELGLNPVPAYEGMPHPPITTKWFSVQGEILKTQGLEMRVARRYKQLLVDGGFEAVVEEIRDVPWGRWPKDERNRMVGYWHIEQLKKGLHGIIVASLSRAGWKPVEIEVFIAKLKVELDDPSWMVKDTAYIVYGRKPK